MRAPEFHSSRYIVGAARATIIPYIHTAVLRMDIVIDAGETSLFIPTDEKRSMKNSFCTLV